MQGYEQHPDAEVRAALVRLCDMLCSWERSTGRTSALVLREQGGYCFRAASGKPCVPEWVTDSDFIACESGQNGQEETCQPTANSASPKLLEFINWWRVNWKDSISHTALEELDLWIQRNCQA